MRQKYFSEYKFSTINFLHMAQNVSWTSASRSLNALGFLHKLAESRNLHFLLNSYLYRTRHILYKYAKCADFLRTEENWNVGAVWSSALYSHYMTTPSTGPSLSVSVLTLTTKNVHSRKTVEYWHYFFAEKCYKGFWPQDFEELTPRSHEAQIKWSIFTEISSDINGWRLAWALNVDRAISAILC